MGVVTYNKSTVSAQGVTACERQCGVKHLAVEGPNNETYPEATTIVAAQ